MGDAKSILRIMSVTLSVPQWSVSTGSISLFTISGSGTWLNPTVLTGDPYYGSMFSNTSSTVFLTRNYVAFSTPGTLFTLKDSIGRSHSINLIVTPPAYTVSSAGIVYVSDPSTNLPIMLMAPTSVSAYLVVNDPTLVANVSTIARTISVVFKNYNFGQSLPTGLVSSLNPSTGNVTITGTPTSIRAQSTYTLYARSGNQLVATDFPLQVASARYQFSNISATSVSNAIATGTLTYKVQNRIIVGVAGIQGGIQSFNLPPGMNLSYSGTQIDLSGIPTRFLDSNQNYEVVLANYSYSTKLTYALTMNPCLEIVVPTTLTAYSNVPYTTSAPLFKATLTGYPTLRSLTISSTGMNITPTGLVYGTISQNTNVIISASAYLTSINTVYSNSASVSVQAIPDVVTISYNAIPLRQNVKYSNTFTATVSSGQPVTYSVSPRFDGPIGLILDPSGSLRGTPRGVSIQSNYTITAVTPQGVSRSLPIVLQTIPDFITISSYGLYPYSVTPLPMIQGHTVLQSEYSFPLEYKAKTESGDPIVGILSSNFPPGLSLANNRLVGTPRTYGNLTGTVVARSLNGVVATLSLEFRIAQDVLILPISTDFVVELGTVTSYSLSGYTFSASRINSYSLSNAPPGVLIRGFADL